MKLTRVQQLGVVGFLAGLADTENLLETLDATGEAMAADWMKLSDDQTCDIINELENGMNNLRDAFESLDNEFK